MFRRIFLTFVGIIALAIGLLALIAPHVLITVVKVAAPSDTANVMARTVGVLLVSTGLLNLMVRNHGDTPTLKAVLAYNLIQQIAILPIDPSAYAQGVFTTLGSFVPNTILHVALIAGFSYFLLAMRPRAPKSPMGRPAAMGPA